MSLWTIAVPVNTSASKAPLSDLAAATSGLAHAVAFNIPPTLKVGTLDSLMTISEETAKMDPFVGGVAKKIEKTYYELFKTEAQEARDKAAATPGNTTASSSSSSSSSTSTGTKEVEKAPELRIEGKTPMEYVMSWRWNEVRYPTRSALPLLVGIIVKDTNKNDDALKKQVAEYNEVRTSYTAIERKDQGTLLVRPLGPYVKAQPIETVHLTTLMIIVPRARKEEFMTSYETFEQQAAQREAEEAKKKVAEAAERAQRDAERKATEAASGAATETKSAAQIAHEKQRAAEKEEEAAKAAEAAKLEAEMIDPAVKAAKEAEQKEREDEEKRKNKKLPKGCNAVVPGSAAVLCDVASEEFILISVVVLKQGSEQYKNLCREKRYTIRPFKFDPEEDKAERERKVELAKKKKNLWNFLIRWCTTTYSEIFTAWIHLKAIRLYVESVLRYGLPYNSQAILIEPGKGKEKQLRDVLRQLYAKLAGSNANLTTALDPNEPDLSGLGSDFYSYVYLPLTLND